MVTVLMTEVKGEGGTDFEGGSRQWVRGECSRYCTLLPTRSSGQDGSCLVCS